MFPPLPEPEPPVWPDDYPAGTPDPGPRLPWWPGDLFWPPEPKPPVSIENQLPPHIWPRLPPDHSYHLPPGHWYPDSLPPGHPGSAYPGMPDQPALRQNLLHHAGWLDAGQFEVQPLMMIRETFMIDATEV
ncbi:hypothetical protein Poly51_38840 [Rubripirellula tenax]|uniref:Uncharacterized protein n=1 Tax=Rubripirellula tenax TaxID=2528015 RepID=A0A5C6EN85_9BACT|nr:hypothetical protein Poly51_38840 [Rubripirellula tenax]